MRRMILRPWVVLLAAGGARRFGSPKLLARVNGETLLRRATRAALGCRPAGCVVVLGSQAKAHASELRGYPVRVVHNDRWRTGLASSLQAGLRVLPRQAQAALVLLADQPCIGPAELELLAAAWRRRPRYPAAARAGDLRLVPAILPRSLFAAVEGLAGDSGARALLRAGGEDVTEVEIAGAAWDVDEPADLRALRSLTARAPRRRSARASSRRRPRSSGAT